MTTLISFLGKGNYDPRHGYRNACYAFDRDFSRTVPFFGMALADYLKPDRLILVGTSGSMWDVFFERESGQHDEALLELIDAVEGDRVSHEMLATHAARLSERLGHAVDCVLIDYARDADGQARLLGQLAAHLHPGEQVAMDVTHSFRHLPMLALVAARFLEKVRGITVDDIYYGAYDMKDAASGAVPVVRLKGMLAMLDWVDALSSYDKDGDYAAFAPLFEAAGREDAGQLLRQAAFLERTNQVGQARNPLRKFREHRPTSESAMFALFRDALDERTRWVDQQTYTERQETLAEQHLARGDYLRAATLGFESIVSRLVQLRGGLDPMNYEHRRKVKDELDGEVRAAGRARALTSAQTAYRDLRELRNALAHGSRSSFAEIQQVTASQERLHAFLADNLKLVGSL